MRKITCSQCGSNYTIYKNNGSYIGTLNGMLNEIYAAKGQLFVCASCKMTSNHECLTILKHLEKDIKKETHLAEEKIVQSCDYDMAKELYQNYYPYPLTWYLADHDRLVKIYTVDYPKKVKKQESKLSRRDQIIEALNKVSTRNATVNQLTEAVLTELKLPLSTANHSAITNFILHDEVLKGLVIAAKNFGIQFEEAALSSNLGKYNNMAYLYNGEFKQLVVEFKQLRQGLANLKLSEPENEKAILEVFDLIKARMNAKSVEIDEVNRILKHEGFAPVTQKQDVLDNMPTESLNVEPITEFKPRVELAGLQAQQTMKRSGREVAIHKMLNSLGFYRYPSKIDTYLKAYPAAQEVLINPADPMKRIDKQIQAQANILLSYPEFDQNQLRNFNGLFARYNKIYFGLVTLFNHHDELCDKHSQNVMKAFRKVNARFNIAEGTTDEKEVSREDVAEILGGSVEGTLFENY